MSIINLLSDDTINKIAAGEVIERPASVLKELLENSLDAGADQLLIAIVKGGTKLIRVTDNGTGMDEADAMLALKRHATSKISNIDDLENIDTLGFRGEALPSIAAVSKITITTRLKNNVSGCTVASAGGKNTQSVEAGCPAGTTVSVEELFFNTPARLKFLKSDTTETGHITALVQQLALSHSGVNFEFKINGKTALGPLPKNQTLIQRIAALYSNEIIESLIPVYFKNNFLTLSGFITKPLLNYPNNRHQFFFVNRRPITGRLINHAIMTGYGSLLQGKRYPGTFLSIEIEPALIDVNIHPSKREIRFRNENAIHTLVVETIQKTLKIKGIIPEIQNKPAVSMQQPLKAEEIKEAIGDYLIKNKPPYKPYHADFSRQEKYSFHKNGPAQEEFARPADEAITPLAQFDSTYIIYQEGDSLLIIDQHAAWERINYENIKTSFEKQNIHSQQLLIPINIEISPQHTVTLKNNMDLFNTLGFELSDFGGNSFIIKATPSILGDRINYRQLLMDMLDILPDLKGRIADNPEMNELKDNIYKIMACRSSVKTGDTLSRTEMEKLYKQLYNCSVPYACPHGRPTMIRLTKNELEKKFKRQ